MAILGQQTGRSYNFLQLKGLFRLADLDGSGSIDFNEFLHVTPAPTSKDPKRPLKTLKDP